MILTVQLSQGQQNLTCTESDGCWTGSFFNSHGCQKSDWKLPSCVTAEQIWALSYNELLDLASSMALNTVQKERDQVTVPSTIRPHVFTSFSWDNN